MTSASSNVYHCGVSASATLPAILHSTPSPNSARPWRPPTKIVSNSTIKESMEGPSPAYNSCRHVHPPELDPVRDSRHVARLAIYNARCLKWSCGASSSVPTLPPASIVRVLSTMSTKSRQAVSSCENKAPLTAIRSTRLVVVPPRELDSRRFPKLGPDESCQLGRANHVRVALRPH